MDWLELAEVTWKSLVVFILLVVLARLMGKKLLSRLTFFDFVIGVTIGSIGGSYVVASTSGLYVLLSPVVLTAAVLVTGFLSLKSLKLRKIMEGEPVIIIQNGRILDRNLRRIRYNLDHLSMELRTRGVFDLSEVEFAVLEPHGKLSVLKKSQYQPVTPADLGIPTRYKGLAAELIKDGEVLEQNLGRNGLSRAWLDEELRRRGIDDATRVILATLQTDGSLYVDVKQDELAYVQRVED